MGRRFMPRIVLTTQPPQAFAGRGGGRRLKCSAMEKSIVHELQDLAANGQTPILDVLRKALMVASKLKIQDFREWVEDELGGYRIKSKPPTSPLKNA